MRNGLAQGGAIFATRKDLIIAEILVTFVDAVQDARATDKL
jgi:hypothetical protein